MGVTNFDVIQANAFVGPVSLVPGNKVWYVNNATSGLPVGAKGGSNGNAGDTPQAPFSTLAGALAKCVAGRGDIIYIMPDHAETLTAALTISVNNVQIVGVKVGNKRPTYTINGAVDLFNITGSGVLLSTLKLTIATTDAATALVNVAGANCHLYDLQMIPSSGTENVVDCITLASGATDCRIEKIDIRNTTVAVNSFLSIEAAIARLTVKDFLAFGDTATAGIIDAAAATQLYFDNVNIGTVGTTQPGAILDSNPTGFIKNCNFAGTSTTLANNAALGTGVRMFDVKVLEETDGSKQGANIPAVDAD